MTYVPKFLHTRLLIPRTRTRPVRPPKPSTKLDDAEGWIIASFRCNNDCSDDKAIHYALDALSDHFKLERDKGSVRKRMDAMAERASVLGPRGRAVIVGCFGLRDGDNDGVWGVGGTASVWSLMSEAKKLEEERRAA